jgi:hypothetical protein
MRSIPLVEPFTPAEEKSKCTVEGDPTDLRTKFFESSLTAIRYVPAAGAFQDTVIATPEVAWVNDGLEILEQLASKTALPFAVVHKVLKFPDVID